MEVGEVLVGFASRRMANARVGFQPGVCSFDGVPGYFLNRSDFRRFSARPEINTVKPKPTMHRTTTATARRRRCESVAPATGANPNPTSATTASTAQVSHIARGRLDCKLLFFLPRSTVTRTLAPEASPHGHNPRFIRRSCKRISDVVGRGLHRVVDSHLVYHALADLKGGMKRPLGEGVNPSSDRRL